MYERKRLALSKLCVGLETRLLAKGHMNGFNFTIFVFLRKIWRDSNEAKTTR